MNAHLNKVHQEIRLTRGDIYFWLSLASAVDTPEADETCRDPVITVEERGASWTAVVEWSSSTWDRKCHHYRFEGGRLEHWIEVEGRGHIAEVTFLSGTVDGQERGSIPGFEIVYNATPNFIDKPCSHPSEYTAVSAGNITELWGSALNGGPLLFAFGKPAGSDWIAAGLEPEPGQHSFHTMAFNKLRANARDTHDSIIGTQAITLVYPGLEAVDGSWQSPRLIFFADNDPKEAVQTYCDGLRDRKLVPRPTSEPADWWADPIFCTWHEQVALGQIENDGRLQGREAQESSIGYRSYVTEANVQRWLDQFASHDIHFGTIILDAKWQTDDGLNTPDPQSFPDLRGFIDRCHDRNHHVILWMTAWEPAGLPAEWCVMRDGEPVMADPTHPEYRAHVAAMVERMLGPGEGCYNADGLKIDGTNVLPGQGIHTHGGHYGFELLHTYLKLMYDAAKFAKPDALVTIYNANPYFADCCDMVRLGDLYTYLGDPVHTMQWRADSIHAGLPHALLDTDGALRFSMRDDALDLFRIQAEMGVPTLYQAEHVVQMRPFAPNRYAEFRDADYAVIRDVLAEYRERRR